MNRDVLISQILNNPPYQLPPVIHGNGVFSLDIEYLGEKLYKIGFGLEEVLESYFHFVTKTHHQKGTANQHGREPVRPGSELQTKKKLHNPRTHERF